MYTREVGIEYGYGLTAVRCIYFPLCLLFTLMGDDDGGIANRQFMILNWEGGGGRIRDID